MTTYANKKVSNLKAARELRIIFTTRSFEMFQPACCLLLRKSMFLLKDTTLRHEHNSVGTRFNDGS